MLSCQLINASCHKIDNPMETLGSCLSFTASMAVVIPSTPPLQISHKDFSRSILQFQKFLAQHGIDCLDTIALALSNSIEFSIAFLATTLQRAICAPLNPAYKQARRI